MELASMTEPKVTIVVVPRERFSYTRESLESIYEHTEFPFALVYVDGGSPPEIQRYLEAQALAKQFQLVRTDYYLSPNHARNLGLRQVNSKYVVFVDNDVVVTPGWLSQLVRCAQETGASVITPLVCVGKPEDKIIHCAGGEAHIAQETKGEKVKRHAIEKLYKQGKRVVDVRDQLQRQQTELAEFHCMFVSTEIFEQVGYLDEAMLSTREHIDFCMTVAQAGGKVYFEPESVVTYVPGAQLELRDIPFYMLRWSDAWAVASLQHFRYKWDLSEDESSQNKRSPVEWRRKKKIIDPLVSKISLRHKSRRLERILVRMDKALNRYLTTRYAKRQLKLQQTQPPTPLPESPANRIARTTVDI